MALCVVDACSYRYVYSCHFVTCVKPIEQHVKLHSNRGSVVLEFPNVKLFASTREPMSILIEAPATLIRRRKKKDLQLQKASFKCGSTYYYVQNIFLVLKCSGRHCASPFYKRYEYKKEGRLFPTPALWRGASFQRIVTA